MKTKLTLKMVPISFMIIIFLIIVACFGSHVISVFNDNKPLNSGRIVVLDAGHGGIDGGATSCTGVLESELNLKITHRLNDLLLMMGISTVMIRTEDVSVYTQGSTISAKKISDLKNRVAIVNHIPNSLLVSIHQNHFINSRYSGMQVFYADDKESQMLAQKVQETAINKLESHSKRSIKKANGIYLMEKIKTTGILIECGFLSNPEEEQLLRDKKYQQKLCSIIATVLSEYINDKPIA